ncbi:craniofacial development protein 2-like [Nilaparvata lugens]|uniref:craniofacial development protein 2-like n=1 Tax=Nilaparvata lugens TaxID=108931 RepID=UPI00193DACDF|nr:craniofacial development protein 2-like [Nilaparvata lugens]
MTGPDATNIPGGKTVPYSDLQEGTVLGDGIVRCAGRAKKAAKKDLKLATWNVQTMLRPGKMMEIAEEMTKFDLDIVALQEIRWQSQGRIEKQNFTMYYSGPETRTGLFGTGFIINKKLKKHILAFDPVSDGICKLRIKCRLRNITIISVHAPTEEKSNDDKEEFYDILKKTVEKSPKYDMKLILGDFNAKVGQETFMADVAGKFSLHEETSDNGRMLGQFAAS